MEECGIGVSEIIEAAIPKFLRGGNHAVATAERPSPATPAAHVQQPAAPSAAAVISLDQPTPATPATGSVSEPVMPPTGIVVEPSQMREPVTRSIPALTQPEAPITGSLQERAQAATAPKT